MCSGIVGGQIGWTRVQSVCICGLTSEKIKFAEICATQTEQDWCWSARDHRFHEEVGMLKEQRNRGILPYSRRASLIVELSQTV